MEFVKDFTIEKEGDSAVKITGEIPVDFLATHRSAAIKVLGKNVKMDGFREGHVPEEMLVKKIGEVNILTEMAERALAEAYPKAVVEHKIEAIGHPEIQITKIAPGNPLGFTAKVAVMPEITLGDYKKIAGDLNKDKATTDVTDDDLEKQIKDILRQRVAYERLQQKAQVEEDKKDESNTDLPTPETVEKKDDKETHTHADGTVHEGPAHAEPGEVKDDELPELTDEYVKGLGQPGQFETVDDFKKKLREHLEIQKKQEVEVAHRAKITDKIIEESKFTVPQILIDSELNQMFAQMNEDLGRANLNMDDYLKHIKKSKEDLQKEWHPAAEKRARLQLVLNEIAKVEEVKPDEKALEDQVKQLKEQYKDADEARVRVYVASVMQNEAVMQMLEKQ